MLTSYVLMWENYDGNRLWEAVTESQLEGFVDKIANEGAIPASIMVGHNPILFRYLCKDLHQVADVFFGRINEEIYGIESISIKREPVKVKEIVPYGTKYGWISPDGRYFHCEYSGHRSLADRIVGMIEDVSDSEKHLENLGWAKISSSGGRFQYSIGMGHGKKLTDGQVRTIDRMKFDHLDGILEYL